MNAPGFVEIDEVLSAQVALDLHQETWPENREVRIFASVAPFLGVRVVHPRPPEANHGRVSPGLGVAGYPFGVERTGYEIMPQTQAQARRHVIMPRTLAELQAEFECRDSEGEATHAWHVARAEYREHRGVCCRRQ